MEQTLTIADVKRMNIDAGYHFFDQEIMKLFGSRVESELHGNTYFVTSEQDREGFYWEGRCVKAWEGKRRYTVRVFEAETGSVETEGEFGGFATLKSALKEIKNLIEARSKPAITFGGSAVKMIGFRQFSAPETQLS